MDFFQLSEFNLTNLQSFYILTLLFLKYNIPLKMKGELEKMLSIKNFLSTNV